MRRDRDGQHIQSTLRILVRRRTHHGKYALLPQPAE